MAIISRKYPYFSEDENGKWKHFSKTFKVLIEPTDKFIQDNPYIAPEEVPSDIEILQNEVKLLKAKNIALSESNAFLEECLVEMAEIVYA